MARRNAANKILNKIREHSGALVSQALMVSDELIRVAILWHEQWHEALEEASRLYFGDRNIQGMLAKLEPLHAMLEKGPQTLKETSFHQVKYHFSPNSHFQNLIIHKIHIFKVSLFTKFTFPKSHFSPNSQFQILIFFHKIHNFKISFYTKFIFSKV